MNYIITSIFNHVLITKDKKIEQIRWRKQLSHNTPDRHIFCVCGVISRNKYKSSL